MSQVTKHYDVDTVFKELGIDKSDEKMLSQLEVAQKIYVNALHLFKNGLITIGDLMDIGIILDRAVNEKKENRNSTLSFILTEISDLDYYVKDFDAKYTDDETRFRSLLEYYEKHKDKVVL